MAFDPERYRGFLLNVEMADGRFLPSYHDSLNPSHGNGGYSRLPKCADASKDRAIAKAHAYLDKLVEAEMAKP